MRLVAVEMSGYSRSVKMTMNRRRYMNQFLNCALSK